MNNERGNTIVIFLLVTIVAILASVTGVFGKIALFEIPPLSFTFLRFFIAALILLPFSFQYLKKFKRKDLKLVWLSLLASANVVLFAFGIRYTTVDTSAIIYSTVPIISAIFSYYLLGERFGVKKIIGIVTGFAGVSFVVLLPVISQDYHAGSLYGNLIIVVAAVSISLYWVISKIFQSAYSAHEMNSYFIFTSVCILFFLSTFDLLQSQSWWTSVSWKAYVALAIVGVCTALTYYVAQVVVKKVTPTLASMSMFLQPFATFILSFYFLSETLSLAFLFGTALSLLGIWIYTSSNSSHELKAF